MRAAHTLFLVATAVALVAAASCTGLKEGEQVDAGTAGSPEGEGGSEDAPTGDGAAGDGAAGDAGGCASSCNAPMKSVCNGGTSKTTLSPGRCEKGQCVYPEVTRPCKAGSCRDGLCEELTWSVEYGGATTSLYSIWGTAPDDVWASGDGVFHYDGSRWSPVDVGVSFGASGARAFAVSGTSRDDVALLVGNVNSPGTHELRRRSAGRFGPVANIPCNIAGGALFELSPREFFVHCGSSGVFRVGVGEPVPVTKIVLNPGSFPGGGSQPLTNGLSPLLFEDGELQLMIAGGSGTGSGSFFYSSEDGGRTSSGGPSAVSVMNAKDVFGFLETGLTASLYPTDGGPSARFPLNESIGETEGYWRSLVGTGRRRIFAGGSRGVIARHDGLVWSREAVPDAGSGTPIVSMWASPWGDVFAAGKHVWQGK